MELGIDYFYFMIKCFPSQLSFLYEILDLKETLLPENEAHLFSHMIKWDAREIKHESNSITEDL